MIAPANSQSGFSLTELMLVVAIIAVLAALAVPRYTRFQVNSKSVEARTLLQHTYHLQELYRSTEGTYGTLAQIG